MKLISCNSVHDETWPESPTEENWWLLFDFFTNCNATTSETAWVQLLLLLLFFFQFQFRLLVHFSKVFFRYFLMPPLADISGADISKRKRRQSVDEQPVMKSDEWSSIMWTTAAGADTWAAQQGVTARKHTNGVDSLETLFPHGHLKSLHSHLKSPI